jgi:BASS family bile acid:Na+ symporter
VTCLVPIALFLVMLSIGMSLRFNDLLARWKLPGWGMWTRLWVATFLVPPLLALALGKLLPIDLPTRAGLFVIAIVPGAALMTKNVTRSGFDLPLAASFQIWCALMIPIVVPLLVVAMAKLYDRDIWIPPRTLLAIITKQQLAPLLLGMVLKQFAPAFSARALRPLNLCGNALVAVTIVVLLWELGPALRAAFPWVVIAALCLAMGCLIVSRVALPNEKATRDAFALSNVNRNVGLALLLSNAHVQNAKGSLPVLAAYLFLAPLVMVLYARWLQRS